MAEYKVIDKWQVGDDDYALIDRGEGVYQRWVVAHWVDYSTSPISWGAGHYFEEKDEASLYMLRQYEATLIHEAHQAKKLIKQIEDGWDREVRDGHEGNMHCDTYGVCSGTSCTLYWKCHG